MREREGERACARNGGGGKLELGWGPSAAAAAVINQVAGPFPAPVCRGDHLAFAGLPGACRAFRCVNRGSGARAVVGGGCPCPPAQRGHPGGRPGTVGGVRS